MAEEYIRNSNLSFEKNLMKFEILEKRDALIKASSEKEVDRLDHYIFTFMIQNSWSKIYVQGITDDFIGELLSKDYYADKYLLQILLEQ